MGKKDGESKMGVPSFLVLNRLLIFFERTRVYGGYLVICL